ncbi:hypothetical protein BP5796_05005 [Coleophoma crateriformis]|uniref:Uncharacterized protein n=1 Tax=Coleophoma crateriformis TaxID=565419 RepID=A0A3D8SBP6_9HELO|nr:hypothetical protein BP5796_05005 [Coleophoma crateriformis]
MGPRPFYEKDASHAMLAQRKCVPGAVSLYNYIPDGRDLTSGHGQPARVRQPPEDNGTPTSRWVHGADVPRHPRCADNWLARSLTLTRSHRQIGANLTGVIVLSTFKTSTPVAGYITEVVPLWEHTSDRITGILPATDCHMNDPHQRAPQWWSDKAGTGKDHVSSPGPCRPGLPGLFIPANGPGPSVGLRGRSSMQVSCSVTLAPRRWGWAANRSDETASPLQYCEDK